MAKKESQPAEKPAKKKRRPLVLIAGLLVGLIVIGGGGLIAYIAIFPDDFPKPFYFTFEEPMMDAAAPEAEAEADADAEADAEGEETSEPVALPLPGEGLIFDTGTKIVNLTDPGGRRYLKVGVVLEFAPHVSEFYTTVGVEHELFVNEFSEEMNPKRPLIDDLLITILSSKSFDQVYTVAGKEALRQEITTVVNELLPSEHLMYVYFTEFVVQ